MVIAIDIDEVLFPLKENFYRYINQRFNTSYDWRNPHYELAIELGKPYGERVEIYFDFLKTETFRDAPPIPGSVPGIEKLARLEDLYAVTSRQDVLREDTERFLKKYFPGRFSGLEMGNHHNLAGEEETTKMEMCRKIGARLLIEDQLKYAIEVSRAIHVILFSQPWNLESFKRKNIFYAQNWDSVVQKSIIIIGRLGR